MSEQARIVVIGGGAIGCGVGFQLAEAGISDVLVVEREPQLCAVTSAQAAGLVGQVRSTVERTRLAMWSVATFERLERDGEVTPGWRRTGSLRVAQTPERVAEFERLLAVAREAGLEAQLIDAAAARRMCFLASTTISALAAKGRACWQHSPCRKATRSSSSHRS